MAKVSRTQAKKGKTRLAKKRAKPLSISLPLEYENPIDELDVYAILIHGEKKIGKTSLAIQGEGKILLLQNDPPQKAYRRIEVCTPDWRTFKAALRELQKLGDKFPYSKVVLDGADTWFHNCQEYVCTKLGIEHPSEEGWGKGWEALRNEFQSAVKELLRLPCGVWFICHSNWKEIETRRHKKVEKLVPRLTATAEEILNGLVDAWFAYDYEGTKRVLILQGDERVGAGHRISSKHSPHFQSLEGIPLASISMGKSPEASHKNLVDAFHNRYAPPKKVKKKVKTKKGR